MKVSAKFENAGDMQVTITTTLPLREWKAIADRTQRGLKDGDGYHCDVAAYHARICSVIDKVCKEFVEESE